MDFTSELNKYIESEEVKELGNPNKEGFIVDNDRQADYVIRQIKNIRKEKDKITESAKQALDDYKAKVENFTESNLKTLNFREEYLTNLLENYAREQLQGSKKKSIKLIEGTIGFHKKPIAITYDDSTVLDFLKEHPELSKSLTKTTVSLDKSKIRKLSTFNQNSECLFNNIVIPGITAEEQSDSFSVK